MRVFVAGATGAIGRPLVTQLVERGHDVAGMTRSNPDAVRALGAEPVVADGLDRDAVVAAVDAFGPDAVVHQMTALAGDMNLRRFDRTFALTNRLRTEGTDNLIAAAGGAHVVAQSFASWPYARVGGAVKAEDDPLDDDPPRRVRSTLEAIRYLERAVVDAGGCALRYGGFYGPGTSLAPGEEHFEAVRKRQFPIVGDGGGVWSFIHVYDAAEATVLAVEQRAQGVFNVVDDSPERVREWLPDLAEMLGAKPPRRVPRWVGRLFAGEHGVAMMTEIRGASNAKAKRVLGWQPEYPSWRDGVRATLA